MDGVKVEHGLRPLNDKANGRQVLTIISISIDFFAHGQPHPRTVSSLASRWSALTWQRSGQDDIEGQTMDVATRPSDRNRHPYSRKKLDAQLLVEAPYSNALSSSKEQGASDLNASC